MQPYFFPYAQQFRHIAQCDRWIVFDTVKFSRKSWSTRNRIASRQSEFSYITVPIVKNATSDTIAEAQIAGDDWQTKIFDRLRTYESIAPFYDETIELVDNCFEGCASSLGKLNSYILKKICSRLGIETEVCLLSEMELALPDSAEPGQWALFISQQLGAAEYSNASGGKHLFDENLYAKHGIKLTFYEAKELRYQTRGVSFVPDLSIIDSLMWLGQKGVSDFAKS